MRPVETLLEEGIERGFCAVCHVGSANAFDLQAQLVGTLGKDDALRDTVTRGGGLCNVHAWRYARIATDVSLNDLFHDLLLRAADQLENNGAPALPPRRCFVCVEVARREQAALALWLSRLREPAEQTRYLKTRGFCLRHLKQALAEDLDPSLRRLLVEHGAQVTRRLAALLGENVRKHKALLRHEITREERASPEWVLWHVTGPPGSTGSE